MNRLTVLSAEHEWFVAQSRTFLDLVARAVLPVRLPDGLRLGPDDPRWSGGSAKNLDLAYWEGPVWGGEFQGLSWGLQVAQDASG